MHFIDDATKLSEANRKAFGSRSKFHATLADFINGVDKARHGFRDLLIKYIDSIWHKYDVDNSNSIGLTEVKQLI